MEFVLRIVSTLVAAFGLAWMIKRVLAAFQKQSSSIKIDKIKSAETNVKLYRRGLPELPYGHYRKRPRSAAVPASLDGTEEYKDLTVLAVISEHFDHAEELASIGYFENAIDELELALALEPGNADIYEAIGDLYMELVRQQDPVENLDAAIQSYQHAIGLQAELVTAYYKLGVALERRGFKAEAKEYLELATAKGLQRDDMEMLLKQLRQEPKEDN